MPVGADEVTVLNAFGFAAEVRMTRLLPWLFGGALLGAIVKQ
jgi:hypothetical protein